MQEVLLGRYFEAKQIFLVVFQLQQSQSPVTSCYIHISPVKFSEQIHLLPLQLSSHACLQNPFLREVTA